MPVLKPEHAAYIAEAVAAPYQTKRRLPVVRAAPPVAGYVRPVQRSLFELCGDPAAIQPGIPVLAKPEPVEALVTPPPAEAVPEPTLSLTFDMGRWMKAHGKDHIDFERAIDEPHRVSCPPFHVHDEDSREPIDEFLGQVVGVEASRALLFRRRDPCVMDGCEVGQRYVLLRFWDDEEGQVWSMPVDGHADEAVHNAIRTTTALYRGHPRAG